MPQKFENVPPNWDDIEEECQHVSLNCSWTITSEDETLAIIITCLKWTSSYVFWTRVTAHPEENPNFSEGININKHHPLLESLSQALKRLREFSWTPFELPPTSYSWRTFRFFVLRRYNSWNGQCSSSLPWLGSGQILWHRPRPRCRSVHPLNRVQE